MWFFLQVVLRILTGISGFVLIWLALFLYEDEEGHLQSKVEEWWVRIHDLQGRALSTQTAIIVQVARISNEALNRVFGNPLLSLRSLAISFCFVVASDSIFTLRLFLSTGEAGGATILLALSLSIAVLGSRKPLFFWLGVLFLLVVKILAILVGTGTFFEEPVARRMAEPDIWWPVVLASFTGIIGGVVVNFALIALARWSLRPSLRPAPTRAEARRIKLAVLAHLSFLVLPTLALWSPKDVIQLFALDRPAAEFVSSLPFFLIGLALSNLALALPSLIAVGLGFVLLSHRILWSVLSRPIYSAARHNLFRERKMLIGSGVLLIALALAPVSSWWKIIAKKLGIQ